MTPGTFRVCVFPGQPAEPGKRRGQECDRNAREGGSVVSWLAPHMLFLHSASPLLLLGAVPCPSGGSVFL